MTVFVLTYDLIKERSPAAYKPLIDELERLGAHRYQASSWMVNLSNTPKEAHDHFKGYLDDNDKLFISELTKLHHFSNANAGTNDWLRRNPPTR
ncbi:hypothetical protein [Frigidibacter sp. MR17.24]|uniref:hypothetical protein n=1 Tax=Frigidibacter sp. MR17.24 TaxID=3127345 RepID=UPI003012A415